MRQILIAVAIALATSILLTPALIRLFTRQGFGHEIRADGPPSRPAAEAVPATVSAAATAPSTRRAGSPPSRWASWKRTSRRGGRSTQ